MKTELNLLLFEIRINLKNYIDNSIQIDIFELSEAIELNQLIDNLTI